MKLPKFGMKPAVALLGVAMAVALPVSAQEVENAEKAKAEAEAEAKAKPKKITDRQHPDYIRCRRERVIGSLAKRRKICMTNREWKMIANEGNRGANELVDEMRATSVPNG